LRGGKRLNETGICLPEVSYLAQNTAKPAEPAVLFSGGSLLVGAVSRTDLLGHQHATGLAHELYHSLHAKILPLGDDVIVHPTHGAGSFCTAAAAAAVEGNLISIDDFLRPFTSVEGLYVSEFPLFAVVLEGIAKKTVVGELTEELLPALRMIQFGTWNNHGKASIKEFVTMRQRSGRRHCTPNFRYHTSALWYSPQGSPCIIARENLIYTAYMTNCRQ